MDEFMPGNTDPERRGRVAYERLGAHAGPWAEQDGIFRLAWCHAAEAAFEEGRVFEREQAMRVKAKALKAQLDELAGAVEVTSIDSAERQALLREKPRS